MYSSVSINSFPVRQKHFTLEDLEEETLIISAAKKDRTYFKLLYNRYFTQVYHFVHRRLMDAEHTADITSQVFLKAMIKLEHYQYRKVPFSAWLLRIAINEVNYYYRKTKTTRRIPWDEDVANGLGVELEDANLEYRKYLLLEVLSRLKVREFELIRLRFFEEMSYQEIGQILAIKENNAKVKVHRILKKIKKDWPREL